MERLTKRTEIGLAYFPKCFEEPCEGMGECKDNDCSLMIDACEKLAEYEDLEEQGLILRLPCKIGDTVFRIWTVGGKRTIAKFTVSDFRVIDGKWYALTEGKNNYIRQWEFELFGKTVFLSYEEAYCALCKQSGLTAVCKDAKTGYVCEQYKRKVEKEFKEQEVKL